jgi:hypothetical protein
MGMPNSPSDSTWIRDWGMFSECNASTKVDTLECAMAHSSSHVLQPKQRSECVMIVLAIKENS